MDQQLEGFKQLMGENSKWAAQVAASPQISRMPADPADTVVFFEANDTDHAYPRIIANIGLWTFDNHGGNEKDIVQLYTTFEIARTEVSPTELPNEYFTVCKLVREICEEASEDSYAAGGEHLAQVTWELVEPPDYLASEENEVVSDIGTNLLVWYFNFVAHAKTS